MPKRAHPPGPTTVVRTLIATVLAATAMLASPTVSFAADPVTEPAVAPTLHTIQLKPGTKVAVDGTEITVRRVSRAEAAASGVTPADAASGLDICAYYAWGSTGYTYCDTESFYWQWQNDTEYFMLGLDWAVWHIWKNSRGWKSLGGHALEAGANGVWSKSNPLGIKTIGLDGDWWCRDRGNGSWPNGWYHC